jgi:L-ascorbate metabolism protein UlaG (beta-lactamase superfamily)
MGGALAARLAVLGGIWALAVACDGGPEARDRPHHTGQGFRNLHGYDEHGPLDVWRWRMGRWFVPDPRLNAPDFPLAANDPGYLRENRADTTLTWIGHATVLLQAGGKNILTDPHFSGRASPVQWAGPERLVAPGLSLEELPPIDAVVISHDHYDSLDEGSIVGLYRRPGGKETTFFVPLGLKAWFARLGIERVVELDWWESHGIAGMRVTAVPVQHWSKRRLFGRNQTLWAGWVVESGGFRFCFAGDSGYTPHFREVGERLGPFDLAAIPIGAYAPRWFMGRYHINPEEAVQVHRDLRARCSVAIHWGTFILTDEPLGEPPLRLARARAAARLPEDAFLVLRHGETITLEVPQPAALHGGS